MKVTDEMVEVACQTWLLQSVDVTIGHAMKVSIQAALNAMPKQEPFSDDTLNDLRQNDNGRLNFVTLREFREVARAVEKAHGIGV